MRHRCVGAVLVHGPRFLLCHRAPDREWFPDAWDIPGGHVDAGESSRQALARELQEELAIVASVDHDALCRVESDEHAMTLEIWRIGEWEGTPVNCSAEEHDTIAWFELADLPGLALADDSYRAILTRAVRG